MIPSVLTHQVCQGIKDFLHTTFPIATPFFHGLVEQLLESKNGVFKGPFLSIQLPFRQGNSGPDFFPDIPLQFKPYLHQEQAFNRLSGARPSSTIVATGTGSGKTECFLYPILDHCYKHRGEPGIKAILIYPMNALATDQAGRLARIIFNSKLKGHVTAGLFVGQKEKEPRMVMSEKGIITNKDTLRLSPPDILLTNYKMLDYLLIRAKDFPLWEENNSDSLRYLVVDELHTFDGAQGTDLACLLRRLKARLGTPEEFLCCIGTSATLGSQEEQEALQDYAEMVFGEPYMGDAVITESRIGAGEFLEQSLISYVDIVPPDQAKALDPEAYAGYPAYILGQVECWLGDSIAADDFPKKEWRVELGERLKAHLFFQNLLKVLGGKIRSYEEILNRLEKVTAGLKGTDRRYQELLLNSLLALVSEARTWAPESREESEQREAIGKARSSLPFLHVRIQQWLRELRRMVAEVNAPSQLRFADDLQEDQLKRHLPIVHCRECGSTGWAGVKRQHDTHVLSDLQSFYVNFFNDDPKVVFLFPEEQNDQTRPLESNIYHVCTTCLALTARAGPESCPSCGNERLIRVFMPNTRVRRRNKVIGLHDCPYCNAVDSLTIMGSRAASLTSVLIAQLYASGFNDDKKLLTFSDSVQDAAHRAGFFGARTYRFNFRSAMQQFLLQNEGLLSLAAFPDHFIRHWSGEMEENAYIATFLAPNMAWFADYDHLKHYGRVPENSKLREDVDQRIKWEIFSEYGFSARIGRTLEKTGCSVAHLDSDFFEPTVQRLL
ncbi:MAG: DEAD/DEAH box helicase, partial [Desulfoferrobacter sp.]